MDHSISTILAVRPMFTMRLPARRHRAVITDVRDATRLLDALENCHTITPFFTPTEVPGGLMSLGMYRHALPYTVKPLQGPGVQVAAEVRYAVKMAEVIGPPAGDIDTQPVAGESADHSRPRGGSNHRNCKIGHRLWSVAVSHCRYNGAILHRRSNCPAKCGNFGSVGIGPACPSRTADDLLRATGDDGTAYRNIGLGWG